MSIESYNQGASIFIATGDDAVRLAEEQLNTARACDLGASARSMSKHGGPSSCSLLPQGCPTNIPAVLSFILVLKGHSIEIDIGIGIGIDVLLGVYHCKTVAFQAYVTRMLHMESVQLEEQMLEPSVSFCLIQEIQVVDTILSGYGIKRSQTPQFHCQNMRSLWTKWKSPSIVQLGFLPSKKKSHVDPTEALQL